MCGSQDGSVVAAHSNLQMHGKGMGIKAEDCYTAWLCGVCHSKLDQGSQMSKLERKEFMLTAIARTYAQMLRLGILKVEP